MILELSHRFDVWQAIFYIKVSAHRLKGGPTDWAIDWPSNNGLQSKLWYSTGEVVAIYKVG